MDAIKDWISSLSQQRRRQIGFTAVAVIILAGIFLSSQESQLAEPSEALPRLEIATTIRVHVVGEVVNPGLYELPIGAIANDAIQLAGGLSPEAAAQSVNLARVLVDGEQLIVLSSNQLATESSGMLSLNQATESQLEELPGIGPALARRIVEYRSSNGAFGSIEELTSVSGIGPKLFAAIRDQLTL